MISTLKGLLCINNNVNFCLTFDFMNNMIIILQSDKTQNARLGFICIP